jgi:hypothetical protein
MSIDYLRLFWAIKIICSESLNGRLYTDVKSRTEIASPQAEPE